MTYLAAMFAAELVKELRKARGFSARTFGAAVGASDRMVRRYEAGEIDPPLSTAGQMARALGIPLDSLYVHAEDSAAPAAAGEESAAANHEPGAASDSSGARLAQSRG